MTSTERWAPRSRSGERTGVSIGDAAVDEGRVGVRRRAASAVFVVAIGRVRPAAARPLHRPTYPLLAQPPRRAFRRAVSTCSTSTCAHRLCGAHSPTAPRHMLPLLTVVVVLAVSTTGTIAASATDVIVDRSVQPPTLGKPWFDTDCSDPRYKKDIECYVEADGCGGQAPTADAYPSKAHDFRVQPFAKAVPRLGHDKYQLAVDISWQPPTDNTTALVQGFALTILPEGSNAEQCYFFRLRQARWTDGIVAASPRFRFVTDSMFEFGVRYNMDLQSLPRPAGNQSTEGTFHHTRVSMPQHPAYAVTQRAMCLSCWVDSLDGKPCCPEEPQPSNITAVDCKKYSNPFASRWVAGFRRIFLHSLARTIQIEFVGAPEHYCFEAYEVRLLDEHGIELLYHTTVTTESMRAEVVDNRTVLFGEYNFTNLEVDKDYIPAILPIERASDGRCLCPVDARPDADPYDLRIVCSCLAAEWKKVRLERLPPPPPNDPCKGSAPPPSCTTKPINEQHEEPQERGGASWSIIMLLILAIMLVIVLCGVYVLVVFYRRYRSKGKTIRIRFVSDRRTDDGPAMGNGAVNGHTPLVSKGPNNVLIVYSHDCAAHEAAVLAFAEYLRDVVGLDVQLDVWSLGEIARNKNDYVIRSIQKADKVFLLNSKGAFYRYQSKLYGTGALERREPLPTDDIFIGHLDHLTTISTSDRRQADNKVVSGCFSYTSEANILRPFTPSGQFVIPRNTGALVDSLSSGQCRLDERALTSGAAYSRVLEKISEMTVYQQFEPDWFEESHVRVPSPSRAPEHLTPSSPLPASSSTAQSSTSRLGNDVVREQLECATADDDVGRASGDSGVISDMLSEEDSCRLKGPGGGERARLQLV